MADRTIAAESKVAALLYAISLNDTRPLLLQLQIKIAFKQGSGEDCTQERLALELIETSKRK